MKTVLIAAAACVVSTSALAVTLAPARLSAENDVPNGLGAYQAAAELPLVRAGQRASLMSDLWVYVEGRVAPEPVERATEAVVKGLVGRNSFAR